MPYKGTNAVNPGPDSSAEGQINFKGDQPPTQGPALVYKQGGLDVHNPTPPAGYDLDMNLGPNEYPEQTGSDSYSGIPGDGIVPG
jgi:hypothetical protein